MKCSLQAQFQLQVAFSGIVKLINASILLMLENLVNENGFHVPNTCVFPSKESIEEEKPKPFQVLYRLLTMF